MVDVESLVITAVDTDLKTSGYKIKVSSVYDPTPSSFPSVSVIEEDNRTYRKSQDDVAKEHHAEVLYTVNVYSNKKNGAKGEAKKIFAIVDNTLQGFKFTRTSMIPDSNADKSIYRIVARYEAIISEPKQIGNDTVWQVYRE